VTLHLVSAKANTELWVVYEFEEDMFTRTARGTAGLAINVADTDLTFEDLVRV
jgi:hypothetical protein